MAIITHDFLVARVCLEKFGYRLPGIAASWYAAIVRLSAKLLFGLPIILLWVA